MCVCNAANAEQNKLVVPAACSESPIAVDFRVPARSLLDIWRAAREERSGITTTNTILYSYTLCEHVQVIYI
jgi:hypothetical protein